MYAQRPLSVEELAEVLSVRDGDWGLREEMMDEKDILELCHGFVVVQSDTTFLQFTHQQFLQDQHLNDIGSKRVDIATACLSYLQFDDFNEWRRPLDWGPWLLKYRALAYIPSYWGHHVREAEDSAQVQVAAVNFLLSERKRNFMTVFTQVHEVQPTLFHVIAANDLGIICRLFLEAKSGGMVIRQVPVVSV